LNLHEQTVKYHIVVAVVCGCAVLVVVVSTYDIVFVISSVVLMSIEFA
jgi:hypothetical protein